MVLRNSLLVLLFFILLFTGGASANNPAASPDWQPIVPGIDFREFQLPDPNNVFVARMDRNNPNVILESAIAQGKLSDGRETVSEMYQRYDQVLNFWGGSSNPHTWGMRNRVVVAINGSYFDLPNGVTQGGQVQSGWYVKRYTNLGGWGGFVWKLDRSAFISECLYHIPAKQIITFPATGVSMQIDNINAQGGPNKLDLYTPQFGTRTNVTTKTEIVVEMTYPTMIFPAPAYVSGIVREINHPGNSLIPFNSVILSIGGAPGQTLLKNISIGSEIRFSQEITSYEYNCETPYALNWTKAYASLQGAFFFLKNGQIREFNNDLGAINRRPRTAIAFNDQYIYYIVVDGRDVYHSVGMTITELAVFARDTLGANWGVAQDGGGSSTMVINGRVVNNTYCNINTCAGYSTPYTPVDPSDLQMDLYDPQADDTVINPTSAVERKVVNGMLMVQVQSEEYSYKFRPGERVATISDADMRLGPGTNYDSFANVPKDQLGIILDQMNGLDGVLAKSTYWWYVEFGGMRGWVPEGALLKQAPKLGLFHWFILH
jgi:hypothetical protein